VIWARIVEIAIAFLLAIVFGTLLFWTFQLFGWLMRALGRALLFVGNWIGEW
jgi:hypothetical protein